MVLKKVATLSDLVGRLGMVLGWSWALLELSWPLLERSREPLGAILVALGSERVVFKVSRRPRTGVTPPSHGFGDGFGCEGGVIQGGGT